MHYRELNMAQSQPRSHTHQSGSARDTQTEDRNDQHVASSPLNDASGNTSTRPHHVHDSHRHNAEASRYQSGHSNQHDHVNTDSNSEHTPEQYYGYNDSHYQNVLRAWRSRNPHLEEAVNNTVLREAIARLEGQDRPHCGSSTRQPSSTPIEARYAQNHHPDWSISNNRQAGTSNDHDTNRDRSPTPETQRQLCEEQRAGPYDGVWSVGQPSDYDARREEYARYQYEEEHEQYFEEEYDDYSSGTFC